MSPTSSRCVYKGVAEVSIYIGDSYKGQGLGNVLMTEVIKESEKNGIWHDVVLMERRSKVIEAL